MGRLELSEVIDRPPSDVFRFVAEQHVRNHPRWDPEMHLEQLTSGPIGVGTRIRRQRRRPDTTIEGEMEVVRFEPDRVFALVIRDGPMELRTRLVLEPVAEGGTRITGVIEADENVPLEDMRGPIAGSLRSIKALVEAQ